MSGLTPYAFVGAGGITVQRDRPGRRSHFARGAGKLGVGISYRVPRSDGSVYVEGAGWVYRWDRYGFDKMQLDTTVSGGVSYRFGL